MITIFGSAIFPKGDLYESAILDLKQCVLDGYSENDTIAGIRLFEEAFASEGRYNEASELRDAVNDWHNGTIKSPHNN